MVKKIIGIDEEGKQVFARDAREYDRGIANQLFGVTIGDLLKAGSVVALGVMIYANQQHFNTSVVESLKQNSQAIGDIRGTLDNLNLYLSATTGKVFHNGRPL